MGWLLTEPERPYRDASKTNVQDTWRKYGWIPPSELRQLKDFATISALPLLEKDQKK
jgi:hypothetical protein